MKVEHCFANGERVSDEVFLSNKKPVNFEKNKTVFSSMMSSKNASLEHISRLSKDEIKNS